MCWFRINASNKIFNKIHRFEFFSFITCHLTGTSFDLLEREVKEKWQKCFFRTEHTPCLAFLSHVDDQCLKCKFQTEMFRCVQEKKVQLVSNSSFYERLDNFPFEDLINRIQDDDSLSVSRFPPNMTSNA